MPGLGTVNKNMYQAATVVYWMKYAANKIIIPGSVDIDLTNICNQNCFYCNSAEFRKTSPGGPKYPEYISLLDKLSSWRSHSPNSVGSLQTITYPGGGEPSLLAGFEKVIEHTLDLEFLTSITTNGYRLDKLIDHIPHHKLKKLGWIGIDIDAGESELYEQIRRTKNNDNMFNRMKTNALELCKIGINVDFKVLLCEMNTSIKDLKNIFSLAKEIGVRMLYFRPMILDDQAFVITSDILEILKKLSVEFSQPFKTNLVKYKERTYNRCHQMFQFPIFCADGEIYVCCENKGNPRFSIGRWREGDFRDIWLGQRHHDIYKKINTNLCQPCRPNGDNNAIQYILDNPAKIETLYL
jgi:sulfatase maturation enzyme AslB (radical SAM superfamily)